ncbi:uncharacterized protein LOC124142989 [Haliotis rufescens]|uniref:uncharacterized protein LOC124142989 n=1 Tax=Haliotis rufescens TaxID=6454 RepID=UPI00201F5EDF|nr:uncharacterized protein LOC124142989 [Haliotis rufescens]
MQPWGLIVFVAVLALPAIRSQGALSECPHLTQDTIGCSSQFLKETSIKGFFTNFTISQVFDSTFLLSSSTSILCQASTKTLVFDFCGCVYAKFLACIPSAWQRAFPSLDQIKKALDYLCNNINDVDHACAAETGRSTTLLNCVPNGSTGGSDLSTPDGYLATICSSSQLSVSCIKTAYGSCPKRTGDVLAELEELGKPAACDACTSPPSLLLVLFSVLSFMLALLK